MDLFALLAKAKTLYEAVRAGNLRIAADLAGDFLKLASQFLPTGSPTLATPIPTPDLQPLTMPGGFDLGKLIELIQMLKTLFGK